MDNVKTTQLIYEAFGRGDIPAILDQLADEVAWDQDAPSYGVPLFEPGVGKQHVEAFFGHVAGLEISRFEPTNFLAGGNQVVVTINFEGKVKATGKNVKALEIHLWTFGEDGKVTRFHHAIDRQAFVEAYGLAT